VEPGRVNRRLAQDVSIEETFFGGKGFVLSPDDFAHPRQIACDVFMTKWEQARRHGHQIGF
jgi:hypothetical protein